MEKNLNALLVVMLSTILLGAFGFQVFENEQPCSLCLLQRLGLIGIATGALMNIKFGIRTAHYALSILSALFGGVVSLRQISLHVCPSFPQWGSPFWGLSLYTWALIIAASSVLYIAALLLIFDKRTLEETEQKMNGWQLFAFGYLFLVAIGNIICSFWLCGIGPCSSH